MAIFYQGELELIEQSIIELNLAGKKLSTERGNDVKVSEINTYKQRKLLWAVLAINLTFFVVEIVTGLISKSMGLIVDSLDMLADKFVYGLSLIAISGTVSKKRKLPKLPNIIK